MASDDAQTTPIDLIVKQLLQENDLYKQNFDKLKQEYMSLNTATREQTLRWKTQLESKTQEFEQLRQQFDHETAQLEHMKLKLMEELEMRNRLERDLQEQDKLKQALIKLQREHNQLKLEGEDEKRNHAKLLDTLKHEHLHQVSELQEELQVWKHMNNVNTSEQNMNAMKIRIETLEDQVKSLLAELDSERNQKSLLQASKEEATVLHTKQYSTLLIQSRNFEEECDRLKRKNTVLMEHNEHQQKLYEQTHEQLLKCEKQIIRLESQAEENKSSLSKLQATHAEQLRQVVAQFENNEHRLKTELETTQKRKKQLESALGNNTNSNNNNNNNSNNNNNNNTKHLSLSLNHNSTASQHRNAANVALQQQQQALIRRLESEIQGLKQACDTEASRVREYEEKCINMEHAKQRLQAQYDEMIKHLKIVEDDHTENMRQHARLADTLMAKQKHHWIKRYNKMRSLAKSKLVEVVKQFKHAQDENFQLQEELKLEQIRVAQANKKIKEYAAAHNQQQ